MDNPTIQQLAADLAAGRTSARKLTEATLARIEDPKGEGKRTFVKVWREAALAAAGASDAQRKAGLVPSLLAGIPVSVKNLCNVRGETTLAGSKALDDAAPAREDAPVVARLRAAGAVMTPATCTGACGSAPSGWAQAYRGSQNTLWKKRCRTSCPNSSFSGPDPSSAHFLRWHRSPHYRKS